MRAKKPIVDSSGVLPNGEKGVAFVRILLICGGIFALLMIGLFIISSLSRHKNTAIVPIPLATVTPVPTTTVAPGTSRATLVAQRISFNYPSSWKFTNTSLTSSSGASRVVDTATMVSPSGVTLTIRTGQLVVKGACTSCKVVHNENVPALDQNIWLNYISTDGTPVTLGSLQMSLDSTCAFQCYFPPTNLVNSGNVMAEIYDGNIASPTPHSLGFFEANDDVNAARKVLATMTYAASK